MAKYIGFCVYRRSYLMWSPVLETRTRDTSYLARKLPGTQYDEMEHCCYYGACRYAIVLDTTGTTWTFHEREKKHTRVRADSSYFTRDTTTYQEILLIRCLSYRETFFMIIDYIGKKKKTIRIEFCGKCAFGS